MIISDSEWVSLYMSHSKVMALGGFPERINYIFKPHTPILKGTLEKE